MVAVHFVSREYEGQVPVEGQPITGLESLREGRHEASCVVGQGWRSSPASSSAWWYVN